MTRLVRLGRRWADAVRWDMLAGTVGALVLLGALLALIVFLPPRVVEHPKDLSPADWLKAVQDLRTTILQGLGGVALIGTLYFSARTLRLNRRGQLTERFTKAVDQLGSEKLAVRLGGIFALEQIAVDSKELHWPAMEVLTAYLREHAPVDTSAEVPTAAEKRLAVDHQAIATVIGRRRAKHDPDGQRLELQETDLAGVQWRGAYLQGANLFRTNLAGAYLRFAHLEGAGLERTNLSHARLERAYLGGARLEGANLTSALLVNTDLSAARGLTWEQLRVADSLPDDLAKRLALATDDLSALPIELPPGPAGGWSS